MNAPAVSCPREPNDKDNEKERNYMVYLKNKTLSKKLYEQAKESVNSSLTEDEKNKLKATFRNNIVKLPLDEIKRMVKGYVPTTGKLEGFGKSLARIIGSRTNTNAKLELNPLIDTYVDEHVLSSLIDKKNMELRSDKTYENVLNDEETYAADEYDRVWHSNGCSYQWSEFSKRNIPGGGQNFGGRRRNRRGTKRARRNRLRYSRRK